MTKRFLIILVALLWSNVGFSEVLKFDCKLQGKNGADQEYYRMALDTDNKTIFHEWKFKNRSARSADGIVTSLNGTKVKHKYDDPDWGTYEFDYSSDPFIEYGTAPRGNTTTKCINKSFEKKRDITFTINDKKEQCEAIGFTPQTDKFADCVLRLVELDVKSQQQAQIQLALSQGNQQVADELRKQRNQQGGQYLMDLGQKLLNPPTKKTTRCTVTGVGSFKTVTCR